MHILDAEEMSALFKDNDVQSLSLLSMLWTEETVNKLTVERYDVFIERIEYREAEKSKQWKDYK